MSIQVFTADIQNAIRYFSPSDSDNFYANCPPGDIRQCCLFEVTENAVLMTVFGTDDVWIQQRIKTTMSPKGIKMLITRESLEKLKKFPSDSQLELRQSSDGILATSFREFNAKGQPIKLDQVILQPYPGAIDVFPEPCFPKYVECPAEEEKFDDYTDTTISLPSKNFYEIVSTTLDCGEHKKDKVRPVRISLKPFKLESNSATCAKFRFCLQSLSTGEAEGSYLIRGSHLPLILGVTTKVAESPVQIFYSEGIPGVSHETLTFYGDLGSASIPVQHGVDFETFKRGLDYISIFDKTEPVAERQIQRDRLEDALKIQNPGVAATPTVVLAQDETSLTLSKKGDVTKKEVSNLPFVINEELASWPECSLDYNALMLLASLTRKLKSIHECETDLIKLRLACHSPLAARARARKSRQKDWLISVKLAEKEANYEIIIPVQVEEAIVPLEESNGNVPSAVESESASVAASAA